MVGPAAGAPPGDPLSLAKKCWAGLGEDLTEGGRGQCVAGLYVHVHAFTQSRDVGAGRQRAFAGGGIRCSSRCCWQSCFHSRQNIAATLLLKWPVLSRLQAWPAARNTGEARHWHRTNDVRERKTSAALHSRRKHTNTSAGLIPSARATACSMLLVFSWAQS